MVTDILNRFKKLYMLRSYFIIGSLSLLIFSIGCKKDRLGKEGQQTISSLPLYPVKPFSILAKDVSGNGATAAGMLDGHKLNGVPGSLSYVNPRGSDIIDLVNSGKSIYKELFTANEFVVDQNNRNTVYPGSIIKGSSIENFSLVPVLGHSLPITVSVSIPTSPNRVSKTLPVPSAAGMFQTVRAALTNEFAGSAGFSRLNYEMKAFNYYQEMKQVYGYNAKGFAFFVTNHTNASSDLAKTEKKTAIMVKFLQQNFTVDMDIPEDGQLIDRTVDPSVFGGYQPYYVNSVTYGRLGIMTIESNEEQYKVETAFRKAFSFLGIVNGSNSLTSAETAILEAAEVKVSMVGVPGEEGVQVIQGLNGLSALLGKGLTYTAQTPGVPIVFKMRYVSDDRNFEAPFEVNYGEFDRVYARIEVDNVRDDVTGKLDAILRRSTADIYYAFYTDPNFLNATEAPNYVAFNYNIVVEGWQQTADGGMNYETPAKEFKMIRNKDKARRLLIAKDVVISKRFEYPNQLTEQVTTSYQEAPGKGYYP
jgi:thiol-activated cytolysin